MARANAPRDTTVLRRRLVYVAGVLGWLLFVARAVSYISDMASLSHPPLFWMYDWHVHLAGAHDLLERDLYEGRLRLVLWPMPTPVFNLPPAAALLAVPLIPLGRELGGFVWLALNLGAISVATIGALRLFRIPHPFAWAGLVMAAYSGMAMFIVHVALGNVNHIMLALIVSFVTAHIAGRQRIAGLLLGAAVAVKVWPVVLAVLLLRERKWREIRWAAGLLAVQGIAFLAWLGPDILPLMFDALRTPIPTNPTVAWTSWARDVLGWPAWIGPALAATLLIIPARGWLGLGLGIIAGVSVVNNVWDHYLPTLAFGGLLLTCGMANFAWRLVPAPASVRSASRQNESASVELPYASPSTGRPISDSS